MVARVAECVFCGIVSGSVPAFVVASEESGLAFLDTRPVFPGHTLVIPRAHIADPGRPARRRPARLLRAWSSGWRPPCEAGIGADGTFVAMNNKVSQSVPHLHTHVVPRRRKDGLRGFFWPRTKYASDAEARRSPRTSPAAFTAS